MAANPKVLNYIDMPIQHLADSVLERMNRKVSRKRIEALVSKTRSLDSEFAIRTTVIVGFPGETEQEFEELLEGLERLRFTHLGIFTYSQEDGTDAAGLPGQIPRGIKEERANRLIKLARRLQVEEIKRLQGTKQPAIIDFIKDEGGVTGSVTGTGGVTGRLWSDAPEIDRVVIIQGEGIEAGMIGNVKITGGEDDTLFAHWIKPD